jgi:hypothetical protein
MHGNLTRQVAYTEPKEAPAAGSEEVMVADVRDGLTPSQMVERKLVSLLKATPLPMSRLQTTPTSGSRRAL